MLTMALIGCLPDNVQQAIKSFSIRHGKQHVTFAFPFMEETLRNFCGYVDSKELHPENPMVKMDLGHQPSVLFFDECLEVVHGFQTFVTILPHLNRPCARSSLPVVLLTLYQRDTSEGICRHFRCLMQTLVEHKRAQELLNLPIMVADLSSKYRELVLDICSETICELQVEYLASTYPGKSTEQLLQIVKEKFLRPCLLSYPEFLRRNIQEVVRQLTTTDPSYFLSLVELLQSNSCSVLDFKKIDMIFKSPAIDPVIRDMWKIWGQEQISRKVFPAGMGTPVSKLGPLYGPLESGPEAVVNMGTLSHVPVKEGLQSVIKCLKSQDISQMKIKGSEHDSSKYQACSCSVCKIHSQPRKNSRLRLYGDFAKQSLATTPSETSAFHLPLHKRQTSEDFCNRSLSSFRLQSEVSTFSYHHRHSFIPTDGSTRIQHHALTNADVTRSAYASSTTSHVVQPLPQYLPLNLKAFSQRMLYGYQMISKPQYPLPIPARPSH